VPRLVPDPRGALALVDSLARGAVDNARSAAAAIAEQVSDRKQLAPVDEPVGPGSLARIARAEAIELLASRCVGRLAYIARPGVPDVVPVNFAVHEGHAYVRTGVGPKLQAAERGERLVLEVDDISEDTHTGWSVVASGSARRLTTREVHALPPQALPTTWANGPRFALLELDLKRVEGRRLT
jgi:hypothetical protein